MPEQTYLPALRFKALTPLFDTVVRVGLREREFKRRLLDQLDLPPEGSVLDVGAGTGTLALQVKQRHPSARVTGLDADPEILAIARRKAAEQHAEGVSFVEALSNRMPFEDATFDAAVSTLFFHHLKAQDKRATLRELARVLKPGGALHVADFGRPADPLQAALFMQVRAFDGFATTAENARGELPRLIAQAGLADVRTREAIRTPLGTVALISARRPA